MRKPKTQAKPVDEREQWVLSELDKSIPAAIKQGADLHGMWKNPNVSKYASAQKRFKDLYQKHSGKPFKPVK